MNQLLFAALSLSISMLTGEPSILPSKEVQIDCDECEQLHNDILGMEQNVSNAQTDVNCIKRELVRSRERSEVWCTFGQELSEWREACRQEIRMQALLQENLAEAKRTLSDLQAELDVLRQQFRDQCPDYFNACPPDSNDLFR